MNTRSFLNSPMSMFLRPIHDPIERPAGFDLSELLSTYRVLHIMLMLVAGLVLWSGGVVLLWRCGPWWGRLLRCRLMNRLRRCRLMSWRCVLHF